MSRGDTLGWVLSVVILIASVAFVIFMVCGGAARAHIAGMTAEMPLGWQFDQRCCGSGDCYSVAETAFGETPGGYLIKATGEIIPYQSTKVLPSPDGRRYRCSAAGKVSGQTYCIYVVKGGV